jgi:hypothetical protein
MAEDKDTSPSPQSGGGSREPIVTNSFSKGMNRDYNASYEGEGMWVHARNAVNNSHLGEVGVIGNEPSNLHCVTIPYTVIGYVHLSDDRWAIFSTNDIDSEIGIFDESDCTYTKIVNDSCLNFKRTNLIAGTSRERYDCERLIYWDDGLNPTRILNINDVPYLTTKTIVNDCVVEKKSSVLNCEALRIAPLIKQPCLSLEKGKGAGSLLNGSYQVAIAYTIDQVRVTDYLGLTEVQSIFNHDNMMGSLELRVLDVDKTFDEFELVLIANIASQTTVKLLGFYSTNVSTIYIDRFTNEQAIVPISDIVVRTEPVEKSDAMYPIGSYLLRVGPYTKFKFNYQPLANKIETRWVAAKYPADYYHKGGNNVGYMRDEVYSFFIRWVYNTGDKSDSYHIPGRAPLASEIANVSGDDAYELKDGVNVKKWQVENTAGILTSTSSNLPDGGKLIATGKMAYWESTEKYPDNKPDIWDALCGKSIRHHKFPDETVDDSLKIYSKDDNTITILGVQFLNIKAPVDLNGNPIESIVGYEILRGSRQGNKTIVSKGLINNMRQYDIPENADVKGLYQNYPYNDLGNDLYLTAAAQLGNNGKSPVTSPPLTTYKDNIFSFHGPDVTFSNPYLNAVEVKVYQEVYGKSTGYFTTPYKHPKFKIPSKKVTVISTIVASLNVIANSVAVGLGADSSIILGATSDIPLTTDLLTKRKPDAFYGVILPGTGTLGGGFGSTPGIVDSTTGATLGNAAATTRTVENNIIKATNITLTVAMSALKLSAQQQQLYNIIVGFIPKRQYAAQYNSHGLYDESVLNKEGNRRRKIVTSTYVGSHVQAFNPSYQINNLNRSSFLAFEIDGTLDKPLNVDNSRVRMSDVGYTLNTNVTRNISSYYGALKVSLPSQYGQIDSIKQLVISNCTEETMPVANMKFRSPVYFGGDVYVNRFTEKNSMFFFTDWLFNEVDNYEYDYTLHINVPYPRYWVNTNESHSEFIAVASKYKSLDGEQAKGFYIDRGYFYLFNSGVRDFFVESEINLAYRDWEDATEKRHYDPYRFTDLGIMFRSDIIKSGNYYKYEQSLSVNNLFSSNISWGNVLPRDYDPAVASTCYAYNPSRIIYSLSQSDISKKDNWRVFLANNYYDFPSPITAVKNLNKTGSLFMLRSQSPYQFIGTEELKLDGTGARITIGDGKLFSDAKQLQAIVNADEYYEYGSCQNRYAQLGTNHGIFWVSQNQGKVFQYGGGGLIEISNGGMKWWFAKYLPSQLLKVFPEYKYFDNSVVGIGVHMIYDNTNEIIYITKKDYKPKISLVYQEASNTFYDNVKNEYYNLGDERAFEDASFTISYDPKSKAWISFHDWIPTFLIPSKNHFMSVNVDSIWKHNVRCDDYCNFYGVSHPWEIEFVSSTGQTVTTTRSIEYVLEAYKFYNDCRDKFHVLDRNFDEAVIYNSEQISGTLQLNIKPKNNPLALLNYPSVKTDYIDILYAKEENKYRFNQFWDITKDRSEFNPPNLPDPANIPMFITEANGYKFNINPDYINYDKSPLERKKFRHHVNHVFLRAKINGNIKYLFKFSNQKIQQSFR